MSDLVQALERCSRFGVKPGLDAIRAVCAAMGDPQETLRVVHVAGTNGKGAVCALVDAALRAAGFRTGRYTSPHLVSLSERFALDGVPVDDARLDDALARVPHADSLTYFELLTAVAFALYAREKVDVLVLETGLGGRLDATNVVRRPAVCAITRIGFDHCSWLGDTLPAIAAEKGGIIKPGVPVVLGAMPEEARATLEQIAAARHAPCVFAPDVFRDDDIPQGLALGGAFNRENAITAMAVLQRLGVKESAVAEGFRSAVWPGRFQTVRWQGRTFLVDGAHNPPAAQALAAALQKMPGAPSRRAVICGFCGDKDVAECLHALRMVADRGFAVPIRNPRSLPASRTAALMRAAGFRDVRACGSLDEALADAPDGTVICGSLFLAGEALAAMGALPSASFSPNEPMHRTMV